MGGDLGLPVIVRQMREWRPGGRGVPERPKMWGKIYDFWPKLRSVTIFASHWSNCHDSCLTLVKKCHDSCLTLVNPPLYVNYTYPDNNNPMQRICEEKARRILHRAFMKDCQWLWGKCVNEGQVAEESRRGPKCEAKFMIFDQSSEVSRFLPYTGQSVTILASHWSKSVTILASHWSIPPQCEF